MKRYALKYLLVIGFMFISFIPFRTFASTSFSFSIGAPYYYPYPEYYVVNPAPVYVQPHYVHPYYYPYYPQPRVLVFEKRNKHFHGWKGGHFHFED